MPYFRIGRNYGYAGTESYDLIEASSQEEAEEIAWDDAIQQVDTWAEEITEEEYNKGLEK